VQALIDLNPRQSNRVLEQALRGRARLELEVRARQSDEPVAGFLAGRDGQVLRIDLEAGTRSLPLHELIGAFCDVRIILSGQLYLFSTCITDVLDPGGPQRLLLAAPDTIHVANRRRFERRTLAGFSQVRLWPADSKTPYIGELCNISGDGLACRMIRGELDELLLVGDAVRVAFTLAGSGEDFDLPASVCNKTVTSDGQQLLLGLEYCLDNDDHATRMAVDRLRAALCDLTTNLTETDGEL
jgi:hypothetical protein